MVTTPGILADSSATPPPGSRRLPAVRQGYDAVVFDFSGVMVSSAFSAIGEYAADHGMSEDAFIEYLLGPYAEDTDHAWHRAERGEIGILDWATDTLARAEADGIGLDLSFMAGMLGELEVYDVMVDAARTLRAHGYRTSLLTNNIAEGRDSWRPLLPLDELFDDIVDSCEVGMRKPNPAIFRLALDRLGGIDRIDIAQPQFACLIQRVLLAVTDVPQKGFGMVPDWNEF